MANTTTTTKLEAHEPFLTLQVKGKTDTSTKNAEVKAASGTGQVDTQRTGEPSAIHLRHIVKGSNQSFLIVDENADTGTDVEERVDLDVDIDVDVDVDWTMVNPYPHSEHVSPATAETEGTGTDSGSGSVSSPIRAKQLLTVRVWSVVNDVHARLRVRVRSAVDTEKHVVSDVGDGSYRRGGR